MAHFRNKDLIYLVTMLAGCISGCAVAHDSPVVDASRPHSLAGTFINTLLRHGEQHIDDPSCLSSAASSATVASELAAILSKLPNENLSTKLSAQCRNSPKGGDSCQLIFHSANKNLEWSAGFSFLTDATGAIRLETLGCFQTP